MKKWFCNLKHKLYRRLSDRLENYIPKEYEPMIVISPTLSNEKDLVIINLKVPHDLTKKLMWTFKVWRAE